MLDYRKMVNSLLVILVVLFSCAFTQPSDAQNKLEQERIVADQAVAEITVYIQSVIKKQAFCFDVTRECHDLNQYHIDKMAEIMVKHGWTYDYYRLVCILLPSRTLLIGVSFPSKINPELMYRATWEIIERVVPIPEGKEPKYRVNRTGISTEPQL